VQGFGRTDLDDLPSGRPTWRPRPQGEQVRPSFYAISITEQTTRTGGVESRARTSHFLKGYPVFKVEQIEGLPAQYTAPGNAASTCPVTLSPARNAFSARLVPRSPRGTVPFTGLD